jgi:hypothetical protein
MGFYLGVRCSGQLTYCVFVDFVLSDIARLETPTLSNFLQMLVSNWLILPSFKDL